MSEPTPSQDTPTLSDEITPNTAEPKAVATEELSGVVVVQFGPGRRGEATVYGEPAILSRVPRGARLSHDDAEALIGVRYIFEAVNRLIEYAQTPQPEWTFDEVSKLPKGLLAYAWDDVVRLHDILESFGHYLTPVADRLIGKGRVCRVMDKRAYSVHELAIKLAKSISSEAGGFDPDAFNYCRTDGEAIRQRLPQFADAWQNMQQILQGCPQFDLERCKDVAREEVLFNPSQSGQLSELDAHELLVAPVAEESSVPASPQSEAAGCVGSAKIQADVQVNPDQAGRLPEVGGSELLFAPVAEDSSVRTSSQSEEAGDAKSAKIQAEVQVNPDQPGKLSEVGGSEQLAASVVKDRIRVDVQAGKIYVDGKDTDAQAMTCQIVEALLEAKGKSIPWHRLESQLGMRGKNRNREMKKVRAIVGDHLKSDKNGFRITF